MNNPFFNLMACAGLLFVLFFAQACETKDSAEKDKKEKVWHLRFGHNIGTDSAMHLAAQKFADRVREKTGNRVRIAIYPNQKLGNDHEMVEMARSGELDIALTPTAKLSTLIPAMQFPDLPFLFPTPKDAYAILDGEAGKLLLDQMLPYGLVGAAIWENGFKQFTANRPIRRPEDFNGLNIRIMKSRIISEQFRALNANPIPIDFHATYQALKDGVVDGQENPLVAIANMKFHEVQSHLTVSNHAYLGYVLYFSKPVFDTLPGDIQKLLMETARGLTSFERLETQNREKGFLATIASSGTEIYHLSDAELDRFREDTAHITEEYREIIGADIVEKAQVYLKNKYGASDRDEIVIGLNADMSLGGALAGESIRRGADLAVTEINRAGGLLGRQLKIIVRDHSGIPARGVSNMEYFGQLKNLLAVVGGLHSPVVLSELDLAHNKQIIYLIPWASATAITHNGYSPNYVFRISACNILAGPFMVEHALKRSRRVALLMGNSEWGRDNLEVIGAVLERAGIKPVAVERYNWTDTDMTPQLTRMEKANTELILTALNAPGGVALVRSMIHRPVKIPIVSHWGITGGQFFEPAKKGLETIPFHFIQTFSFLKPRTPAAEKLMRAYFAAHGTSAPEKIPAPAGVAHAYDLVHLLAAAVKKAGSFGRPAVRDALERIEHHEGAVKTYAPPFTPERHDALGQNDFFMAVYDTDGAIKPAGPEYSE